MNIKEYNKRGLIASSCHMKSKQISCCLPSVMVTKKGRQQLICFDFIWQLLAIHPLLLILFGIVNIDRLSATYGG